MHEPKFGKKCYDCTHRFICWTNREELPAIQGLPECKKCGTELETVGEPYNKTFGADKVLFVRARCPERRWYNTHDYGHYMQVKPDRWILAIGRLFW